MKRGLSLLSAIAAFVYWQWSTPLQLTTRYGTSDPDEPLSPLRTTTGAGICDVNGDLIAEDGEPVVGATIALSGEGIDAASPKPLVVMTDLRGHWQARLSDRRPHRVGIATPRFLPVSGLVDCDAPSFTSRMHAGGALLRGVIQGQAADHLGEVAVLASPQGSPQGPFFASFSDRHGVYWLRLAAGEYRLATQSKGYATSLQEHVLLGSGPNRFDFWLARNVPVDGRLTGADRLAGVQVTVFASPGLGSVLTQRLQTTSNVDGSFAFQELPPGPFEITARSVGSFARRLVYPSSSVHEHVELELQPAPSATSAPEAQDEHKQERATLAGKATLSGFVRTALDEPLGRAWITAERIGVGLEKVPRLERSSALRADGSFELGDLPAGRFFLRLSTPIGPRPWKGETPVIDLAEGGAKRALDLVADSCLETIGGKVVDSSGKPVDGATVWAQPALPLIGDVDLPAGSSRVGISMPNGRFVLANLCAGPYRLFSLAEGGHLRAHLEVNAGTVHLVELTETAAITGQVMEHGEPVRTYRVTISGPSTRNLEVEATDGRFSVQQLEPGEYQLLIRSQLGYAFARVALKAGEAHDQLFDILPFRSLRGRLREHDGSPIAEVRVTFRPDFTDATPDFTFARDVARRSSPLSVLVADGRSAPNGEFELRGLVAATGTLSFETSHGPLLVSGGKLNTALGTLGGPAFALPIESWRELLLDVGDVEIVRR